MAGPYGITQVDIGGALGMYQAGRQIRTEQLRAEREEAKLRREQERENALAQAWAKAYGAKGGDQASGGTAPSAPPVAGAAPSNPLLDPAVQQDLIRNIGTIDPEKAMGLMEQFGRLNDTQMKRAKDVYATIGNAALWLRNTTPEQRQAEYARILPGLRQMGIPEESLRSVDLSDNGLEYLVSQGRDVEKIIDAAMPKAMPLQPGGKIGEYIPPSPFREFGAQAPQAVPLAGVAEDQVTSIIRNATRTGEMSAADMNMLTQATGNPNGIAAMKGYLEANKIAIIGPTGQRAWYVNGRLYDNPEGR